MVPRLFPQLYRLPPVKSTPAILALTCPRWPAIVFCFKPKDEIIMMFISKFNKLIRNKFVWSGFAFIVILSFVAWQTKTGGISEEETKNAAGKLDGKPVPAAEMRSAYFNSYLYMSLMVGRALKITPRAAGADT